MAVTVALDGTNITLAQSTTGWNKLGLISAPVQETDIVLYGTYSVSSKASNKDGTLYYDYGSGLDFTTTYVGHCVYIWLNCTTLGAVDLQANGGLAIFVGSSTSNYHEWYVLGSDTTDVYPGGWIRLVIDPTRPPSNVGGTGLDLTSVQYFGITINTTGAAKAENLIISRIDVAKGLRIYGTDTDGWADVAADELTNRYGILQDEQGEYFAYGALEVGDDQSTNGTTFSDTGRSITWISQTYYLDSSATAVPCIPDGFHGLRIVSNATNATSFTDGISVGSGDTASGRAGTTFKGAELHRTVVELDDGNNSSNDVNLYGTTFKRIADGITWINDSDHAGYGLTITECGQFDPVGAPVLRDLLFASTVHWRDPTVHAAIADDGGSQTDETTAANSATTNDVTLTPATPANSDAYYVGHDRQFDEVEFDVYSAGSGFTVTWQYYNGATWANLTGVVDETQSWSTVGRRKVTFTIPGDWATTTVNSQGPYYYVRGVLGSVSSPTQAKGSQIWTHGPADGSALKWNSSINIKNAQFLANADDTNDPHGIEHPASGSYDYYAIVCNGNDYDLDFSAGSGTLTINADSDSSVSTYEITGGGSTVSIISSVTLSVKVVIEGTTTGIQNAQVGIFKLSDDTQLMNEDTLATGYAEQSYNYTGDVDVYIRVRKNSPGDTRYRRTSQLGQITNQGMSVVVGLTPDTNV